MYVFTPYANENQLKSNADNYNVELISNDKTIHRTEWKNHKSRWSLYIQPHKGWQ